MEIILHSTKKKEIIDISQTLEDQLKKNNWENGLLHCFIQHTSACITTAELDPGTDQDYLDAFEAMMPKLNYQHPHDPKHVTDHILSSIIGPARLIPVENSKLVLGTWQSVVLIELNGPRERVINLKFIPT